jgi:hypothetical protein
MRGDRSVCPAALEKARGRRRAMGPNLPGRLSRPSRVIILILFASIFTATLGAGSLKKGSEEMEVTGKVYVMGNEPFTHVAIETKDGQVYVLLGEQANELRRLQGRSVSVLGKPSEEKPRGAKAIEMRSFQVLKER